MTLRTAITTRNAALDAELALLNNGFIRIYSGAMPATPETAASGTLLAELTFGATAFAAAVNGVATANAITADASANATNTAGYARLLKSDGTSAVFDGDCGASGSGAFAELNSTSISAGAEVSCTAMTITLGM
jgi:hypothetical protein